MSSGFVTETELAEARKRRQEEWEKVRQPDQPLERPEEPYDGRSLYDRLKEQKMQKDMEYEEAHKFKNLIRGLDDDEVQFLELIDQSKIDAEKKQMKEEEKELKDFRDRVATLQEESAEKRIQIELKAKTKASAVTSSIARPTQRSLLGVGIKRKNGEITTSASCNTKTSKLEQEDEKQQQLPSTNDPAIRTLSNINTNQFDKGEFKCVAILPGIGPYTESSDSEVSSGSEDEPETHNRYDLVGRKQEKKKLCQED